MSNVRGRGEGGVTLIQTKQKRAGREQRNKYKPRTETSTKQEQKQEQHLTIRHAGRPADLSSTCLSVLVSDLSRTGHLSPTRLPYGSEFSNFSLCTLSKLPPLASPCLPLPPLASPCLPLPPLASPCLPLPPLASPCLPLSPSRLLNRLLVSDLLPTCILVSRLPKGQGHTRLSKDYWPLNEYD